MMDRRVLHQMADARKRLMKRPPPTTELHHRTSSSRDATGRKRATAGDPRNQEMGMKTVAIIMSGVCALLSFVVVGSAAPARAAELPSYFKEIVGIQTASPAEIGTKNILQLNTTMFELYGDAGQLFRKNILAEHPLILGLFSGVGGRFILYLPGMAPVDAAPVPIVYQLLKSVAHSTMALGEVVVPYLNSPNDLTWRGSLAAYRDRMQSALDGLDATAMEDNWRPNNRNILQNNIAFMDECLKNNVISADPLQEFAKKQSPLLKKNIAWAAQTQVAHWMDVIGGWKQTLGFGSHQWPTLIT